MGIRVPSTLATRKAIYEVDDVDLIRANTDNTWPIVARYMSDLGLSKGNILLDVGANANLTMSMPYHFDIGPNVFWIARDLNGQVNQLDFIGGFPSPANTAIVTNTWGTGSFTANVRITQPDSNLDIFAVNVYSNSDLVANTGTIRKTSRGNFDLVFCPVTGNQSSTNRRLYFTIPYATNVTVLCIGAGGQGGSQGLAGGASGGGLTYVNNISCPANTTVILNLSGGGSTAHTEVVLDAFWFNNTDLRFGAYSGGNGRDAQIQGSGVMEYSDAHRYTGSNGGHNYDYTHLNAFVAPAPGGSSSIVYNIRAGGPIPYESFNGSHGGHVVFYSLFNHFTGQYSFAAGGGAGGYVATYPYSPYGGGLDGGVTNRDAPEDADSTRYGWHPTEVELAYLNPNKNNGMYGHTTIYGGVRSLSNDGGGAGGAWRASSVFDAGKYSGFGTGIYGWDGVTKTQTEYVNNPGTYPNWNKPSIERLHGGYGARIEGNMHPLFTTTTPTFGAGGAPGGAGVYPYGAYRVPIPSNIVVPAPGGPSVIRIMFDGNKRKFPNVNCGLEIQTTTFLWDIGSNTATWYNGEVVDPDNPYPNVLTWNFFTSF